MMGCTGDYANRETATRASPQSIYLHGYVSARLMRVASAAGGGGEGEDEGEGIPVSVAATLLDGVVLALTPNHHSCNYRSAVAFGRAHAVTDAAERLWALERITDNLVPGRWAGTRYPSAGELRRTGVLRVDVVSASAKTRAGTTGEDRADLADDAVRRRVWAGVVPAHLVWAAPVPAPTNRVDPVPDYLEAWRRAETEHARTYAVAAALTDPSAKKAE